MIKLQFVWLNFTQIMSTRSTHICQKWQDFLLSYGWTIFCYVSMSLSPSFFFFFLAASQCVKLPWLGIEPLPPTVKAQSLNHWTTRDVPMSHFLYPLICWHRFVSVSWLWWIILPWTQGCRYLLRHWFCFLWIYTKKWDCWILYNNFIFKFLRSLQAVFHSGCTSLHS